MSVVKIKPEYLATILVAGMFLLLIYMGGITNILAWGILFAGEAIVGNIKATGQFNPYRGRGKYKRIVGNGWLWLWLLFAISVYDSLP